MSQKIAILSNFAINQIAAGEVVEGPASVIKELVENSIDAHAKNISVEIKGGGQFFIRVSDDGSGMEKEDALLCTKRYATSKITSVEDLDSLHSMGFRGEALAAISSVSKFSIHTSRGHLGIKIETDGKDHTKVSELARLKGTTIVVSSLFYNTPGRKKFQKSPRATTTEVIKCMTRLALSHREVDFSLIVDEKEVFCTKKKGKNRIHGVLGERYFDPEIPVYLEKDGITIEGFITSFEKTRSNRLGQYLIVNKRCVHSPLISNAVSAGFGSALGKGEFPLFFLDMTFDPKLIDVNVHPQKKEIRFSEREKIYAIVRDMVTSFLAGKKVITEAPKTPYFETKPKEISSIDSKIFENFSYVTKEDEQFYAAKQETSSFVQHQFEGIGELSILLLWDEVCIIEVQAPHKKFPLVDDKGHFIVDLSILEQRAHQKTEVLAGQKLLHHEEVFLTHAELELCEIHKLDIEDLGIHFSTKESSIEISSMPEICFSRKKEIFLDILDQFRQLENVENMKENILHSIFQKKKYSREEALVLIETSDGINIGTQIAKKDIKRLCKELVT